MRRLCLEAGAGDQVYAPHGDPVLRPAGSLPGAAYHPAGRQFGRQFSRSAHGTPSWRMKGRRRDPSHCAGEKRQLAATAIIKRAAE